DRPEHARKHVPWAVWLDARLDNVADLGDARRLARPNHVERDAGNGRMRNCLAQLRGADRQATAIQTRGIAQPDFINRKPRQLQSHQKIVGRSTDVASAVSARETISSRVARSSPHGWGILTPRTTRLAPSSSATGGSAETIATGTPRRSISTAIAAP